MSKTHTQLDMKKSEAIKMLWFEITITFFFFIMGAMSSISCIHAYNNNLYIHCIFNALFGLFFLIALLSRLNRVDRLENFIYSNK